MIHCYVHSKWGKGVNLTNNANNKCLSLEKSFARFQSGQKISRRLWNCRRRRRRLRIVAFCVHIKLNDLNYDFLNWILFSSSFKYLLFFTAIAMSLIVRCYRHTLLHLTPRKLNLSEWIKLWTVWIQYSSWKCVKCKTDTKLKTSIKTSFVSSATTTTELQ